MTAPTYNPSLQQVAELNRIAVCIEREAAIQDPQPTSQPKKKSIAEEIGDRADGGWDLLSLFSQQSRYTARAVAGEAGVPLQHPGL